MLEGYYAATSAERWDKGVLNFCRAALVDRARGLGEAEDCVTVIGEMGEDAGKGMLGTIAECVGIKALLCPLASRAARGVSNLGKKCARREKKGIVSRLE